MTNRAPLPEEVVKVWPEIFNSVELNIVPLNYVQSMLVSFVNGRVWAVEFGTSKQTATSVEDTVSHFTKKYKDYLDSINFRLNAEKIKQDAIHFTDQFLKSKNII